MRRPGPPLQIGAPDVALPGLNLLSELVIIPRDRALAGKTVPAAPRREQGTGTGHWGVAPGRSG